MKRFNLFDDERLHVDDDEPDGYRAPYASLRPALGSELLAASLVALGPGQAVCPYHAELIEEEWLFVLDGSPTVRTPEGDKILKAGDVLCFPRGPAGAHKIGNAEGAPPARVLIVAERVAVTATIYEDSDKIGIYGPDLRMLFRRSDARDYWDGE